VKPKDEDKLRAISKATFTRVEQTGLSGLTMAAIAREAGLATGTLYVYFKSKEGLLVALYEEAKTAAAASLMQGDDPSAPFRSRFQRMWTHWLEHRLAYSAQMVFMEQYYNSPWFSEESRNLSARLFKDRNDLFEAAKAQQILKDVPTPMLLNTAWPGWLGARDRQHAALRGAGPHRCPPGHGLRAVLGWHQSLKKQCIA
jgi:AcrR family transcriptional regulator